jgi:hypothetical protein
MKSLSIFSYFRQRGDFAAAMMELSCVGRTGGFKVWEGCPWHKLFFFFMFLSELDNYFFLFMWNLRVLRSCSWHWIPMVVGSHFGWAGKKKVNRQESSVQNILMVGGLGKDGWWPHQATNALY